MHSFTHCVRPPSPLQETPGERRIALTVTLAFVLFGVAWVFASDVVLYAASDDKVLIARIETAKGWAFVGISALFLYLVTLRSAAHLARTRAATRAVVESIGDGLLLLGRDRSIKYVNPAAARMLGCGDAHELVGMGAQEFSRRFRVSHLNGALVPPEHYVSQRVFEEGGPLMYTEILHPPGKPEFVASVTAAAVRDGVGEPPELVVSVIHDVTVTEHLEQLRNQFLSAAAHSLKTPIAVIKANAQLLARREEASSRKSALAIERQCDRIDRLVQNLLVFSRTRSRTLELHPQEEALAPLAEQVAQTMNRVSPRHEVHAELLAAPRAHVDRERLGIALSNLVEEALRASQPDSQVAVLVSQQGADAELGVRYRPLAPAELAALASNESNVDLGVVRDVTATIAEAHGGSVEVENRGAETILLLRLPAIAGAA